MISLPYTYSEFIRDQYCRLVHLGQFDKAQALIDEVDPKNMGHRNIEYFFTSPSSAK